KHYIVAFFQSLHQRIYLLMYVGKKESICITESIINGSINSPLSGLLFYWRKGQKVLKQKQYKRSNLPQFLTISFLKWDSKKMGTPVGLELEREEDPQGPSHAATFSPKSVADSVIVL